MSLFPTGPDPFLGARRRARPDTVNTALAPTRAERRGGGTAYSQSDEVKMYHSEEAPLAG